MKTGVPERNILLLFFGKEKMRKEREREREAKNPLLLEMLRPKQNIIHQPPFPLPNLIDLKTTPPIYLGFS